MICISVNLRCLELFSGEELVEEATMMSGLWDLSRCAIWWSLKMRDFGKVELGAARLVSALPVRSAACVLP